MTGFCFVQIACTLYPTARNSITPDGKIKINTWSTFKSSELIFQLNTPFQESTADGREVTTTALLYGNKLVKDQVSYVTSHLLHYNYALRFSGICLFAHCAQKWMTMLGVVRWWL